jgi:hypothetical protein
MSAWLALTYYRQLARPFTQIFSLYTTAVPSDAACLLHVISSCAHLKCSVRTSQPFSLVHAHGAVCLRDSLLSPRQRKGALAVHSRLATMPQPLFDKTIPNPRLSRATHICQTVALPEQECRCLVQ